MRSILAFLLLLPIGCNSKRSEDRSFDLSNSKKGFITRKLCRREGSNYYWYVFARPRLVKDGEKEELLEVPLQLYEQMKIGMPIQWSVAEGKNCYVDAFSEPVDATEAKYLNP